MDILGQVLFERNLFRSFNRGLACNDGVHLGGWKKSTMNEGIIKGTYKVQIVELHARCTLPRLSRR